MVATMLWLTATEYLCQKWPRIRSLWRNQNQVFPHSWLITGLVTKVTRPSLMERELCTLSGYQSSPPILSRFPVAQSLVFCVVFCRWLFVLFFWPVYCLSFFDLLFLITPLASSSFSYPCECQLSVGKHGHQISQINMKLIYLLSTVSWYKTSLTSTVLLVSMSLNCSRSLTWLERDYNMKVSCCFKNFFDKHHFRWILNLCTKGKSVIDQQ